MNSFNKQDKAIMKLFKAYVNNGNNIVEEFDEEALKRGICIDCRCSREVIDLACGIWGKDGYLLNQTFHKSFKNVTDNEIEFLVLQQLVHYFSTYGREYFGDYDENEIYIPNEKLEVPCLNNDLKLIYIRPISSSLLKERLKNLINSNIALSKESVMFIGDLVDFLDVNSTNVRNIRNKEVRILLYERLDLVPENPEEFVRYMLFKLTGSTILVKSKEKINSLNWVNKALALELLNNYKNEFGLEKLSEVFNRFKPIFLGLKTKFNDNLLRDYESELNTVINKLSHLSKKYHKPMELNSLDNLLEWYSKNKDDSNFESLLKDKLEKAGIWRVIRLKNYLEYMKLNASERIYKIRNGKVWIDIDILDKKIVPDELVNILEEIIINKLKKRVFGKKVYFDNNVELVIPQSEKKFVGNIPFGSSIEFDKDNLIVGVHWFDTDDERVDLDLKAISNEYSIGWNDDFCHNKLVIYSGDITAAPYPSGASEYIYVDSKVENTVLSLKVNNFTRNVSGVCFDFIIAKGNRKQLGKNYIIDPNNIILKIPNIEIELGKAEHTLGNILVFDGKIKFIFSDLVTANRSVANENSLEGAFRKYLINENKVNSKLRHYLEKAGACIVEVEDDADFNFSIEKLNRDTIINLFD